MKILSAIYFFSVCVPAAALTLLILESLSIIQTVKNYVLNPDTTDMFLTDMRLRSLLGGYLQ
jgi:hypothetical protein